MFLKKICFWLKNFFWHKAYENKTFIIKKIIVGINYKKLSKNKKFWYIARMQFKNNYNILDKIIAYLRHYELFKNQSVAGKIIDFGCGSNFDDIFNKYQKASKSF